MSATATLDAVEAYQREQREADGRAFTALIDRVAGGEEVPAAKLLAELKRCGVPPAEFDAAVRTRLRRVELRRAVAAAPAAGYHAAQRSRIEALAAARDAEVRAVYDRHFLIIRAVEVELEAQMAAEQAALAAEVGLVADCPYQDLVRAINVARSGAAAAERRLDKLRQDRRGCQQLHDQYRHYAENERLNLATGDRLYGDDLRTLTERLTKYDAELDAARAALDEAHAGVRAAERAAMLP